MRHPAYPRKRVLPGAIANLLAHDWSEITAAANRSENHVKSPERWVQIAKRENPALTDEQAARLGEMLRTEHYRKMGRLSAQARKLAREAQAELVRAGAIESESGADKSARDPDESQPGADTTAA